MNWASDQHSTVLETQPPLQRVGQKPFDVFEFDLPGVLTRRILERLHSMPSGVLSEAALLDLAAVQRRDGLSHGVYQLLIEDEVVYVWNAPHVAARLRQHHRKLTGR